MREPNASGRLALIVLVACLVGCEARNAPSEETASASPSTRPSTPGEVEPTGVLPEMTPEPPPAEWTVTGRLETIDAEARRLTVMAPDARYEFTYTARTRIRGAADPEDLLALSGAQVTVYYSEDGPGTGPPLAEQILLQRE